MVYAELERESSTSSLPQETEIKIYLLDKRTKGRKKVHKTQPNRKSTERRGRKGRWSSLKKKMGNGPWRTKVFQSPPWLSPAVAMEKGKPSGGGPSPKRRTGDGGEGDPKAPSDAHSPLPFWGEGGLRTGYIHGASLPIHGGLKRGREKTPTIRSQALMQIFGMPLFLRPNILSPLRQIELVEEGGIRCFWPEEREPPPPQTPLRRPRRRGGRGRTCLCSFAWGLWAQTEGYDGRLHWRNCAGLCLLTGACLQSVGIFMDGSPPPFNRPLFFFRRKDTLQTEFDWRSLRALRVQPRQSKELPGGSEIFLIEH